MVELMVELDERRIVLLLMELLRVGLSAGRAGVGSLPGVATARRACRDGLARAARVELRRDADRRDQSRRVDQSRSCSRCVLQVRRVSLVLVGAVSGGRMVVMRLMSMRVSSCVMEHLVDLVDFLLD